MLFNLVALLLVFNFGSGNSRSNFESTIQPDTQQVRDILHDTYNDINAGDFPSARGKLKQAKTWSKDLGFSEGLQLVALRMADVYLNEQFFDSAQVVLEDVLLEYPETEYKIQMYNLLATAFRYKNEYAKAIDIYETIIPIAQEKGEIRTIAAVHQNMAVAQISMGNKAGGLSSYLLSIEYAEAEQDTGFLVIALNNLGNSYNNFGEYEQAEFYLDKSLSLAKEKNLKSDILRASTNLANVKSNTNEFDESLKLYKESLSLSKEIRPNTPPFLILYNMGNLSLKMDKPDEAIAYFEESLGYCLELNISQGIYFNYGGLGNAAMSKGDFEFAIEWHRKALDVALSVSSTPFIQETHQKLYELNKARGNYKNALFRLEEFKSLSDSLLDLEREKSFAELENELELKRQTEINALLTEQQREQEYKLRVQYGLIVAGGFVILLALYILLITTRTSREKKIAFDQLSKQREELEKLNLEMNKLFAIIAHDLRSPLASMQGILYLLKSGDLSKDEIETFTNHMEDSLQKNIEVMEDLLSWAKEQMSGITFVKEDLNIHDLIDSVISKQEYSSKLKEVEIHNQVNKDLSVISDKNALRLVFRNLLSNSIKYTGPGDIIKFTSTELEGWVQLCVADSGVGMSKEVQDRVISNTSISYSKVGTKGEKGTGFGLSLIKEFVGKLEGTITIESEEGKGTKFCIELPKE